MDVIEIVRISAQGQAKNGRGLAYQQDKIRSYSREQNWNLLHIFADEDIDGPRIDGDVMENEAIFDQYLFELKERFPDWSLSPLYGVIEAQRLHQAIL